MTCGVYEIINKKNGLVYVGSSSDVERRFSQHKFIAKNLDKQIDTLQHRQFYIDMNKDFNAFTFKIIKKCELEDLLSEERKYIDFCKINNIQLYNINFPNNFNSCGNHKEYYRSCFKGSPSYKKFISKKNAKQNLLCDYKGEILSFNALTQRFYNNGIEHPFTAAKEFLIKEVL